MREELYHHGILGQKWGVRRFQNADGSLTTAGKKRYNTDGEHVSNLVSEKQQKKSGHVLKDGYQHHENPLERIKKQNEVENKTERVINGSLGGKRTFADPNPHKTPGLVLEGPKKPENPQERAERREKERIDRVKKETRDKITAKMPYSKIIFDISDVIMENGKKYIQG